MKPHENPSPQPPAVVVVEASAGSGKTYALAKHYCQLLLNSTHLSRETPLRSILAITFTNKASIEMKKRIIELLKRIIFDDFNDAQLKKDIYTALAGSTKTIRSHARFIMDSIIDHFSFFQVQTIDSFINALLLGSVFHIDRSAHFRISRNYREQLSYCLDLTIDRASADRRIRQFLDEFLEHYLYVENQKGWLPRKTILEFMTSLYQLRNTHGVSLQESPGSSSGIVSTKKHLFDRIRDYCSRLPANMNKTSQKSIQRFIDRADDRFNIDEIPSVFQKGAPPLNKGASCTKDSLKEWQMIRGEITRLVELNAFSSYNPYIKLFDSLLETFSDRSKKEDVIYLEELNTTAHALFGKDGMTVAEIYYSLASRFKHYLIDEFQDTSSLQWYNMVTMIDEALSNGGSLFYVGDKKQAIYRFRGGESELFDSVRNDFTHYHTTISFLKKNWRSQKAIVDFNNHIFLPDNIRRMLSDSGIADELHDNTVLINTIINTYAHSTQQHNKKYNHGYVQVTHIEEHDLDDRNRLTKNRLIDTMIAIKKRFNYNDVAVLTRDNREVERVTSWLLHEGIPVESDKTMNVLEHPLIKEIMAFLQFLLAPIDNLYFAAFITGDIFCAAAGITCEETRDHLFRQHEERRSEHTPLYILFRETYPHLWNSIIEPFFKTVGFISPYELVITLYRRLNILHSFPGSQAFFLKFLELLKECESDFISLSSFLHNLALINPEDLYVKTSRTGSVKVLTIHTSKGLEFPVVIMPFFRMDITPHTGGTGMQAHLYHPEDQRARLVRITKKQLAYSSILSKIYLRNYMKACLDELNNLYVGCTRAQQEMYIFIPKKSGSSTNKARFLIPDTHRVTGNQNSRPHDVERADHVLHTIPPAQYQDWIELVKDEFKFSAPSAAREQLLHGQILHAMLSSVGNCREKDITEIISAAVHTGRMLFPFIDLKKEYAPILRSIITAKHTHDIFFVQEGLIFCEMDIVNKKGETRRIDRLILSKNKAVIVDFKSSKDDQPAHERQVQEYIDIVRDIYPGRGIKGYILYMNDTTLENIRDPEQKNN